MGKVNYAAINIGSNAVHLLTKNIDYKERKVR